jgi:hypothetical protein
MRERKVAWCSRVQPVEVQALLAEIRFVEFIRYEKTASARSLRARRSSKLHVRRVHDLSTGWEKPCNPECLDYRGAWGRGTI